MTAKKRVAILISGRGSNMSALVDAAKAPDYPAEIVGVFSNRPGAPGLGIAAANGIATACQAHADFANKAAFEAAMNNVLAGWSPEIIALAGFMRLLTPEFCERWAGRLINIHPSLLPLHKGLHTHEQALADGVAEHGCTVHFVTPGMDEGPIIAQARVPVLPGDTAETLAVRVLVAEHELYPRALAMLARREVGFTKAIGGSLAAMPNSLLVRRLTETDSDAFARLRLEALRIEPEAFGSTYDTEVGNSDADWGDMLSRSYIAGGFLENALVGIAGFYPLTGPKTAHRGNVWGVFVTPPMRGTGIGRAVLENVLSHARQHVLQVHLSVVTTNAGAITLYERLGFSAYGTEPRSLKAGDRYVDEVLMVRRFDD